MITQKRVDLCLGAMRAICCSPNVRGIVVGYTSKSAGVRAQSYRRVGFDHLVILADKMKSADALELERRLQEHIKGGGDKLLSKKYAKNKLMDVVRSSAGGVKTNELDFACSVYMAW